jgi:hypothetical protein
MQAEHIALGVNGERNEAVLAVRHLVAVDSAAGRRNPRRSARVHAGVRPPPRHPWPRCRFGRRERVIARRLSSAPSLQRLLAARVPAVALQLDNILRLFAVLTAVFSELTGRADAAVTGRVRALVHFICIHVCHWNLQDALPASCAPGTPELSRQRASIPSLRPSATRRSTNRSLSTSNCRSPRRHSSPDWKLSG